MLRRLSGAQTGSTGAWAGRFGGTSGGHCAPDWADSDFEALECFAVEPGCLPLAVDGPFLEKDRRLAFQLHSHSILPTVPAVDSDSRHLLRPYCRVVA